MATFVIARLTFQEARRRKILWLAFLLGLVFLGLFATGFHFLYREVSQHGSEINEVVNFFMMAGLYVINFLVVMMTVLTSVDTVAGEVTSHTIQAIVTKPLHRWQVVLGKWIGFALMLGLYIILMAGGVVGVVYAIARYTPPNLMQGILLMAVEGLVLLTLSIFGGTLLSTLANGVLVFMLYGLAFIGGWIEQIGSMLRNETAVNLGIISSLIMPSEALWKRAAYLMQPPLLRELGVTPFAAASAPSQAMVIYSLLYILVVLGAALFVFQRRDL